MALLGETIVRCPNCNNYEFKEQKIYTFSKDSLDSSMVKSVKSKVEYICTNCGYLIYSKDNSKDVVVWQK